MRLHTSLFPEADFLHTCSRCVLRDPQYIFVYGYDMLLSKPAEQQVLMLLVLNKVTRNLLQDDLEVHLLIEIHKYVYLWLFDRQLSQ